MNYTFEQGPIRPPSEASSLLIRVTRNCPWNKCEFCHTYKGKKFELRKVEDIKADIQLVKDISDEITTLSWSRGCAGRIDGEVIKLIYGNPQRYPEIFRSVAAWLYYGAETAFLQDANSLIMRTPELVEVIRFLREKFPRLKRITSYARAKTLAKKPIEELKELREAGLSRIHTGLETGYDPLLVYINKGVTAAEQIEAGRRVKQAGMSLSEYVILGLGGMKMWKEHARETAGVLNQIDPDFIRVRTLFAPPGTPLREKLDRGDFVRATDENIVREERLLIEKLEGISSYFKSDHILNLLEEVEGKFPADKQRMLEVIDRYLSLPREEKLNFQVGRRAGFYRRLDDLNNDELHRRVQEAVNCMEVEGAEGVEESLYAFMGNFI